MRAEYPNQLDYSGVVRKNAKSSFNVFVLRHAMLRMYVCNDINVFCERTPLGAALHTSLIGVFAETDMCVGEIACNDIDVRSKSLSLCPFRLRRPGQGPAQPRRFFL